jgi:hypothetical protein
VLAVGLVRAADGLSAYLSLELATGTLSPGDVLSIGLVDVKLPDTGFSSVHIDLTLGSTVTQLEYSDPATALAGLMDSLVSFSVTSPQGDPITLEIHYLIDVTADPPQGTAGFESRFIVFSRAVPEPTAFALFALFALVALVALTRARAARAAR